MEKQIVTMAIDEEGQHSIESDHNLIITSIKEKHPKNKTNIQKQDTIKPRWKLDNIENLRNYTNEIEKIMQNMDETPNYKTFVTIINTTGRKFCGKTKLITNKRKYKPKWFNPEIKQAIKERKTYNKKYRKLLKTTQTEEIQEAWKDYKNKKKNGLDTHKQRN